MADSYPLRDTVGEFSIRQASTLSKDVLPAPELPNIAVIWPPGQIPVTLFKIARFTI